MIKCNCNKYFIRSKVISIGERKLKNLLFHFFFLNKAAFVSVYSRGHSASLCGEAAAQDCLKGKKKIPVLKLYFAEMKYSVCVCLLIYVCECVYKKTQGGIYI